MPAMFLERCHRGLENSNKRMNELQKVLLGQHQPKMVPAYWCTAFWFTAICFVGVCTYVSGAMWGWW